MENAPPSLPGLTRKKLTGNIGVPLTNAAPLLRNPAVLMKLVVKVPIVGAFAANALTNVALAKFVPPVAVAK